MRVGDAEESIYQGLRALPWLRYLRAMLDLCELLQAQYLDRLTTVEISLMSTTLRMVRSVVESGDPASDAATGSELQAQWAVLVDDEDSGVLPGQWNTRCTFQALASEVAGTVSRYSGAERLLLAATERWREPYPGRARRIDPDEAVPDSTPLAQVLAAFERIVNTAVR
jgi:hypothetical protein